MAHPVVWPKKTFFYPIGNTPPVCFTRDISPDDKAKFLLLACGDPRSILYTIHADLPGADRPLDFTCCDWEPAVLARNIILLTMIADDVAVINMWSIFYHFFLDDVSYRMLLAHCRNLIQSGPDVKTWKTSKYGKYIRFCTEESLTEIRHHWMLYTKTDDLGDKEQKKIRHSFTSGMKSTADMYASRGLNTPRASGPVSPSRVNIQEHGRTFIQFWSKGITSSKSSPVTATPHLNPTFVHTLSGSTFNVHRGTNPILAFHTSPALAPINSARPQLPPSAEDFVESAKSQFSSWCSSFKLRIHADIKSNVVIRFFVGESLAFCQALHTCKEAKVTKTSSYASSWSGLQIEFDAEEYSHLSSQAAPLLFSVIDTSNLSDHGGLVNILITTLSLLERKPTSILYTDSLHALNAGSSTISLLNERALGDLPTLSILLGITPSPHLWHFTTHSSKFELPITSLFSGQVHESISWRCPITPTGSDNSLIRFICEPKKLAKFLFSVYLRMFDHENQAKNLENPERMQAMSMFHYVRGSFVAFLAVVKERVGALQWQQTMDDLIDSIGQDRTFMMGLHGYQEIVCQMYLRNVHTMNVLKPAFMITARTPIDRFNGWTDIPPVVCIVLKIPRRCFQALEDAHVDKIGAPMLHCETRGPQFNNIHPSIQMIFGDIKVSSAKGEAEVIINEDPRGRRGNSPVIASFYIASWILTVAPRATQIGLHVSSTPAATNLISQLGLRLTIFSAPLTDTVHIQVVRHRPNNVHEVDHLRNISTFAQLPSDASLDRIEISMNFDVEGKKATSMAIRKQLTDPKALESLSGGAAVVTKPVSDSTLLATFDGHTQYFTFPFPVYGEKFTSRIARKSSYIEIESPIRNSHEGALNLSLNPFAIFPYDTSVALLSIHYLKLDVLATLQLPQPAKQLEWLSVNLASSFSGTENLIRKSEEDPSKYGALVNVKETIGQIFLQYSGFLGGQKTEIFALSNPSDGTGIYALIFVNDMKFDSGSQTIVVDACAVVLSSQLALEMPNLMEKLGACSLGGIVTLDDETQAWRLLLPALAERCRTWKHSNECEYTIGGIPAISDSKLGSLLCSCGKGKDLGSFATKSEWKPLFGEAIRIAIGPLFTFSSQDVTRTRAEQKKSTATSSSASSPSSASGEPKCAKCGSGGKPTLSSCANCKTTKYCSRDCQVAHWKIHKQQCVRRA